MSDCQFVEKCLYFFVFNGFFLFFSCMASSLFINLVSAFLSYFSIFLFFHFIFIFGFVCHVKQFLFLINLNLKCLKIVSIQKSVKISVDFGRLDENYHKFFLKIKIYHIFVSVTEQVSLQFLFLLHQNLLDKTLFISKLTSALRLRTYFVRLMFTFDNQLRQVGFMLSI